MRIAKPIEGMSLEQQPEAIILRLAICGEARGEQDSDGKLESAAMLAVLWTAENRRLDRHTRWPVTLRGVFLQPWQFSCFNPSDPNRGMLLEFWKKDPISWERADTVCDLFESDLTLDPTRGATHYCTAALWGIDDFSRASPRWHSRQEIELGRTKKLRQIGSHVFGRAV